MALSLLALLIIACPCALAISTCNSCQCPIWVNGGILVQAVNIWTDWRE
jgi:cation transport ATPase